MVDQTTLTRSLRLLQKEGLISASERSTMRRRFLQVTPKRPASAGAGAALLAKDTIRFSGGGRAKLLECSCELNWSAWRNWLHEWKRVRAEVGVTPSREIAGQAHS